MLSCHMAQTGVITQAHVCKGFPQHGHHAELVHAPLCSVLTENGLGKCHSHPHFTDVKTEAQGGECVNCPGGQLGGNWDLDPGNP